MIAKRLFAGIVVICAFACPPTALLQADPASGKDLAGLWEAKLRLGPDVHGRLLIEHRGTDWRAEIAGRSAPVRVSKQMIAFELPEGRGSFKGMLEGGTKIIGHWIQPAGVQSGTAYASPVTFVRRGQERWCGDVSPLEETMTLYLHVKPRADGSIGAFLRNPEVNVGRFIDVDHLEREGNLVRLVGKRSGDKKGTVLAEGVYRDDTIAISLPSSGGTFDFQRVKKNTASDFFPRGRPTVSYLYTPPPELHDGWPTASLEDVGMSREAVSRFIQMIIDTPIDSVHASEIHGVLIARHGKLVLEEYFHGEHRDKPHDTRSAAKSMTSTLVGAAIHAGVPLETSTPVYQVMNNGTFPSDLEPRKRALTVENLLTMSSGLDCDDNSKSSPGNEDVMQSQSAQPDWYRYTMDLRMVRQPGAKAIYASCNPNLLGGVLARAAGRPLTELFRDLIAAPLQIRQYWMNLTPTGDVYMGGGVRFRPRDFMKLGQLMMNGGTWNGARVVSAEWCRRATSPLYRLRGLSYGYLWWVTEYPYKDRKVRAFFAGGNGGQIVLGVPDLDLLIAFYGGNYSDATSLVPQRVYVPKYILPAVDPVK
jgi:CubicO group peptidase (beta-lactamase class C family)